MIKELSKENCEKNLDKLYLSLNYVSSILDLTGNYVTAYQLIMFFRDYSLKNMFLINDAKSLFKMLTEFQLWDDFYLLYNYENKDYSDVMKFYYEYIIQSNYNFSLRDNGFKFSIYERNYLNLIEAKNVLIIGPGKIDNNELSEMIDNSDNIVFLNYSKAYSEIISNYSKKRILVLYLSGDRQEIFHKENPYYYSESINLGFEFVTVSNTIKFLSGIIRENKKYKKIVKGFRYLDFLSLNGKFNFVFNVMFDLVIYSPRRISIVGVDLYYT